MTEQQHKTLVFIVNFIKANGFSPSYCEIADHIQIESINGVNRIVKALELQGLISFRKNCARSIRPLSMDVDSYLANGIALFGRDAISASLSAQEVAG